MENNVFSQLFQRHKLKSAGQEARTKIQEDIFLATLRNGKTYADEAIMIVRFVLIVLTAFVIYLGFNYYLDTFREMFPEWAAVLFAIALPLVIELGKIKLAMLGLRSVLFGWWWSTWTSVAFWSVVIALSVGAFVWSYSISTGGIKEVAQENSETKNALPPLEQVLSTATADIDAQISAISSSNTEASGMKTKRGKTTWAGQVIQMNNSASLPSLQAQRAQIVTEKMAWYKVQETKLVVKVNRWAGFIQRFGGWGEWGTLICVLAIGFFELRLREMNRTHPDSEGSEDGKKNQPGQDTSKSTVDFKSAESNQSKESVFNAFLTKNGFNGPNGEIKRNPIGFRQQNSGDSTQNTVSQSSQPVSQSPQQNFTVLGSDQILLQLRTKLQADIPNLMKKNGVMSTISGRINRAFDECFEMINHSDFSPSRSTGAMVYQYLVEQAIPALNGVGYPYERDTFFLKRLLETIPKEH